MNVNDNNMIPWDFEKVRNRLADIRKNGNEQDLLSLIKENSFLLYELYHRKWGAQPAFHEISFGGELRCDFAWLNDNSDGPEWVLVEFEKPNMSLFKRNGEPKSEFHHAIEQVKSWKRYFEENPGEKKRIFGAVKNFRFVLVAGEYDDWKKENAAKFRIFENNNSWIEIRSMGILDKALDNFPKDYEGIESFNQFPMTLPPGELKNYWENYGYMDFFRKIIQ
jgi:hypothetical protein